MDRKWARHHRSFDLSSPTAFVVCVFNRESGEPGSGDARFIRWHLHEDGIHSGAGQWDPPTWHEGGGRTAEAWEASPGEQVSVFRRFYPEHESRWAQTAPFC